jgi:hypothetical protein
VCADMPPTAMCSLCPRKKPLPKKLVRFDSVVDTFSISECNSGTASRVSTSCYLCVSFSVVETSNPDYPKPKNNMGITGLGGKE